MKEYLGDSVYAEFDGCFITLTTENGLYHPSNTIHLEMDTCTALLRFIERLQQGVVNEAQKEAEGDTGACPG